MRLHESKEDFLAAIQTASTELGIPTAFIEKDYWITKCLKNLSMNDTLRKHVVFKGGTSLSKIHSLIKIFSEDVDLALLSSAVSRDGIHHNPGEALLRVIKKIIPTEFNPQEKPKDSSATRFKRVFDYPKNHKPIKGTPIHGYIVIETNTMGNPEPYEERSIESYISKIAEKKLDKEKFQEFQTQFELQPFKIKVAPVTKTLCEKILAIRKAHHIAITEDKAIFFSDRLRHLYDIFYILRDPLYSKFLASNDFPKQIKKALDDDEPSQKIGEKISDSPLFISPDEALADKKSDWEKLRIMTYDDEIPTLEEISKSLSQIQTSLKNNGL